MSIQIRTWKNLSPSERTAVLKRSETDISSVRDHIASIIAQVKERGDEAVREFSRLYDKADLSNLDLQVGEEEFAAAESALPVEIKNAISFAVENVERFHESQKPENMTFKEIRPGVFAGEKAQPLSSAGLYVPRGRGSFPSMLYMLAVPAHIAGVERVCIITPPGPDGSVDPACLYAARRCGVREVYRVGGAQGIAALAYGTQSISPVEKIVGPGSMYVAAAKRLVSDIVDVGLPAGPSESIVIADDSADPWNVTLDLLVESEHGSDSAAILVTTSSKLADGVSRNLTGEMESLPEPRRTFVKNVFTGYGGILLTDTLEEAADFVNLYAPEHLQIQTADPFKLLHRIRNAGEILLGSHIPFSLANYVVGANAVLPTGGKAKTYSAVSVRDFMKYSSVVYVTDEGYDVLRDSTIALAEYEGFAAHANAVRKRNVSEKKDHEQGAF